MPRVPAPPENLPEYQAEIWRGVARILNARRAFHAGDEHAFEALVSALTMRQEAETSLECGARSMVYGLPATKSGARRLVVEQPEAGTLAKANRAIARALSRFPGLSPADRARVEALEPDPDNPYDPYAEFREPQHQAWIAEQRVRRHLP